MQEKQSNYGWVSPAIKILAVAALGWATTWAGSMADKVEKNAVAIQVNTTRIDYQKQQLDRIERGVDDIKMLMIKEKE